MKIEVKIDAVAAQRAIARLGERARDLRPAFAEIGRDVVADAQLRFNSGTDPYGVKWLPLKPATIKARRKGKGNDSVQPLLDTNRLRNSVSMRFLGGSGVEIGTSVRYAAVHQFGGVIEHAARSIKVRLRTDASGNLLKRGNLATFAKKSHKRAAVRWGEAKAWKVNIPARPYIATKERGLPREYGQIIRDALAAHFSGGGP